MTVKKNGKDQAILHEGLRTMTYGTELPRYFQPCSYDIPHGIRSEQHPQNKGKITVSEGCSELTTGISGTTMQSKIIKDFPSASELADSALSDFMCAQTQCPILENMKAIYTSLDI